MAYRKSASSRKDIYQEITNRIIEEMEKGELPCRAHVLQRDRLEPRRAGMVRQAEWYFPSRLCLRSKRGAWK